MAYGAFQGTTSNESVVASATYPYLFLPALHNICASLSIGVSSGMGLYPKPLSPPSRLIHPDVLDVLKKGFEIHF